MAFVFVGRQCDFRTVVGDCHAAWIAVIAQV
jgi:hypothetical protein